MMMTMMMMMIHVPSCNLCSFHYRRHDQPCCYWNHPCSGPVFWNRVLIVANEIRSLCCFVAVVLVLLVAAHAAAEVAIFAFAHCVAPRSASSIQSVTNRSCDDRHCDHCEYCDDSFCCHWHCSVAAAASSTMTNRCLIRTRFHRLSCWYCWPPSASELERQRPRRTWPSSFAAGVPTAQQDTSPSCAQSTCPFSARNAADQVPNVHISIIAIHLDRVCLIFSLQTKKAEQLAAAAQTNDQSSIIQSLARDTSELSQQVAWMKETEDNLLVPAIAKIVPQKEQKSFSNKVLMSLGIWDSRLHLVGMYEAVREDSTEMDMFQREIPYIPRSMIPRWKKNLYDPKASVLIGR
mmetsp:Transcript_2856/g.8004  ORF Transcript_2856/g.8004 Transcript_2856/m.8004 type:complete len:349 (+) Transcript_2856:3-1049(+)